MSLSINRQSIPQTNHNKQVGFGVWDELAGNVRPTNAEVKAYAQKLIRNRKKDAFMRKLTQQQKQELSGFRGLKRTVVFATKNLLSSIKNSDIKSFAKGASEGIMKPVDKLVKFMGK